MPHADVVVIGAGLAGLVAAARLAEAGAVVTLVAKGHASTHWGSGGLDVAAPTGAATRLPRAWPTSRRWTTRTASSPRTWRPRSPGCWIASRRGVCRTPGTSTRRSGVCRPPSAGRGAWRSSRRPRPRPCGRGSPTRSWSSPVRRGSRTSGPRPSPTASGARPSGWAQTARAASPGSPWSSTACRTATTSTPCTSRAASTIPRSGRDDIARFAAAVKKAAGGRPGRVALPAILGLEQHAEAWAELRARLPLEPFEIPLVPPSIPGIRLWRVLRESIRAAGGRVQIGESVARIHVEDGRVTAVEMEAAARSQVIRTEALVLATGGIAGGGLVATARRSHRRAAARAPRGRCRARGVARRRRAGSGRPPDRGGRHPHGWRPPAARPGTDSRRPSPTSGSRERSSPASGRYGSDAATAIAVASGWRAANELAADATRTPIDREPLAVRTDQ